MATLLALAGACGPSAVALDVPIFDNARIGFADGQSREIQQTITFPEFGLYDRVSFDWDLLADADPWDRAGSIHVILPDGDQVQLGKFVTGFNGTTRHREDISRLAPLLSGQTLTVEAHIDTWVADAWRVDATVVVDEGALSEPSSTWADPLFSRDGGFGWHDSGQIHKTENVRLREEMDSVVITYFASGHHHEQTSASDEFNQRRHRLLIDGEEVWTDIPWRTDGPRFRRYNPTSGRWDGNGDGDTDDPYPIDQWSSDFPRSGWVPGDEIHPYEIDVTPWISDRGRYTVELQIDDVDINSFWRVSAYVSGTPVRLVTLTGDFNDDGRVDAADYTVWRDQVGQVGVGLTADADGNGLVNELDYSLWWQNYGKTAAAAVAVPEPTAAALLLLGALAAGAARSSA